MIPPGVGYWVLAALLSSAPTLQDEARHPRVGVYYYPWHGADFHGRQYLRASLDPPQRPVLGEYDDRRADVIRQHAEWSRYARVDCWVASWWGPRSREDRTLRQHVLPHEDLGELSIAIHYETAGRTRDFTSLSQLEGDFRHLGEHYFAHPRYLRIDGRPVVVVYLTRVLAARGLLDEALRAMRAGAAAEGHEVYLIGDHAFGAVPETGVQLRGLDAITNYDVYGALGASGHAGMEAVGRYALDQAEWALAAREAGVAFVPSATPGFNDTAVRAGHAPLARRLDEDGEPGSLFAELLRAARPLADPRTGRLILVTSWNEWHEDTQIEPVAEAAPVVHDRLTYEGYGLLYLDLLRAAFGR